MSCMNKRRFGRNALTAPVKSNIPHARQVSTAYFVGISKVPQVGGPEMINSLDSFEYLAILPNVQMKETMNGCGNQSSL